ncbi:MAG: stage III sporulation protein AF [Actinomycetia bacterium]|nr:stage III sporulation protein AF [Actinomycetes bacterium]
MMAHVLAWVRTLVGLVALGNVLEWLLPSGSLRRYADLAMGLVILLAVLSPLVSWLRPALTAPDVARWFAPGSPAAFAATLARQQRDEVAAMLEALPGVRAVEVDRGPPVAVRLQVDRTADRGALVQAARAAVEEVMAVPGREVGVTVADAKGGP